MGTPAARALAVHSRKSLSPFVSRRGPWRTPSSSGRASPSLAYVSPTCSSTDGRRAHRARQRGIACSSPRRSSGSGRIAGRRMSTLGACRSRDSRSRLRRPPPARRSRGPTRTRRSMLGPTVPRAPPTRRRCARRQIGDSRTRSVATKSAGKVTSDMREDPDRRPFESREQVVEPRRCCATRGSLSVSSRKRTGGCRR